MDIAFHYPPELSELLIQTIPLLSRSKKGVILFFRGAGINSEELNELKRIVETDRDSISKYDIVRRILTDINVQGEKALRERREILKRVTEFEDFSTCWPEDELKAKGLVAEVRRVVDVKDSFTRMKQEREMEVKKRQEEHEARIKAIQKKQEELDQIKRDLFSLFGMANTHKRGKLLEGILNRFFMANDFLIREAFELVGDNDEGVIEQIDGVVEIDGYLYLVEMKWWKEPLGKKEVAPHLVKVFTRGHAGGILISASGFTDPAILDCKEALAHKIVVLCELEEFVTLLENRASLKDFLKAKVNMAVIEKKPFVKPYSIA